MDLKKEMFALDSSINLCKSISVIFYKIFHVQISAYTTAQSKEASRLNRQGLDF